MANISKKIIRDWGKGILDFTHDNRRDTSYGASMIKNFDIYQNRNRLLPMPNWKNFTTEAEKAYGIRVVGGMNGSDNYIYGLGKGLSNWYSHQYPYRIHVVAGANYLADIPVLINLANMPSSFWSHVKSDGSDIRVTNSSGAYEISFDLQNFDYSGHTGQIWVKSNDVYIYYGNSNATPLDAGAVPNDYNTQNTKVWDSEMFAAFCFNSQVKSNTIEGLGTYPIKFESEPNYVSGLIGKAITCKDTDTELITIGNYYSGLWKPIIKFPNDFSISFSIYLDSLPSSTTKIIGDTDQTVYIMLSNTGQITFFVNGMANNATISHTTLLTTGQWYNVSCRFNGSSISISINNSTQVENDGGGDVDQDEEGDKLFVTTRALGINENFCKIANVFFWDDYMIDQKVSTHYNNLINNNTFWTISSEQLLSSITKAYAGVQLYIKDITSGDWKDYIVNGHIAKINTEYPSNSFIEYNNNYLYFLLSSLDNNNGVLYATKTDYYNQFKLTETSAYNAGSTLKAVPMIESPVTAEYYFSINNSYLQEATDPIGLDVYNAGFNIMAMVTWRNYLAVGGTKRSRAIIGIWDLNEDTVEKIDAGTGNVRIVGNAEDILFSVVDNYIENEVLSAKQPTMEIKKYVGNGQMETTHSIRIPTNYNTFDKSWELNISNFRLRRNTQTLFYAKLPANANATEFHQGFFAVGRYVDIDGTERLSLSLIIDTSNINEIPLSVYGFAKQIFIVLKDGTIKVLDTNGDYSATSLYTTLKMNEGNTEIEKKLHGVEIVTEPLANGQTITVYYKTNTDTNRVKIFEMTGENNITYEAVNCFDGSSLPNYKEIEFDIESTGGNSAILELNYKYEYLSELV